ncbi:MAG: dockerin type I repeat-containing protein, partial [Candidatus Omnitrophica bacterium]|nr:dockerin type I repeat-containing protein [Candidatus Omnitrophota bacterium]
TGCQSIVFGDVNWDGGGYLVVNAADAQRTAEKLVAKKTLSPGQLLRADVNGDDKITPLDATLIARGNILPNAALCN